MTSEKFNSDFRKIKTFYENIFSCVNPTFDFNVQGKKIIEILGSDDFPALTFCNYSEDDAANKIIVDQFNYSKGINESEIVYGKVETLDLPKVDEVWVFNVMQRIENPELFIEKLKSVAEKILFFEPINASKNHIHIQTYTFEDFQSFFGDCVQKFHGGSLPNFHSADCAFGIWDKKKHKLNSNNLSVIGIGKLGLCFALSLERSGYNVLGVDLSQDYVDSINKKEYLTEEPSVVEYLKKSKKFRATTKLKEAVEHSDTLFVIVATPSLEDGGYDHSQVENVADNLIKFGRQEKAKHLVVTSTTMPMFCDSLQKKLEDYNWFVSYNPEFIAQGTVVQNQENPDFVLIGEANKACGDELQSIYNKMCKNKPRFNRMDRLSAEITKIGLNCFLVTKVAFANMVGDMAKLAGADEEKILSCIGSDTRIGHKFLKYGYGSGGPCLPRDARAFARFAERIESYADIPLAADAANKKHLEKQLEIFLKNNEKSKEVIFDTITYKKESTLLTESQQLAFAVLLAENGYKIKILERESVIKELKKMFGSLFEYSIKEKEKRRVISFCVFGNKPIYTVGAIENAKLANIHYPGWECRFYVDDNVDLGLKQELLSHGAKVIERKRTASYDGLFWRFEPFLEKDVDVWISRDADSRLSERESLAVKEWLGTDKTFHLMRDGHNHDYPIMAGMFGVNNELYRARYGAPVAITCPPHLKETRDSDQKILENHFWHNCLPDHICHDHWSNNLPKENLTVFPHLDPSKIYSGRGMVYHVTHKRQNFPNLYHPNSINKAFPEHKPLNFGLYVGQIIEASNQPSKNEGVIWEYELRGEKID